MLLQHHLGIDSFVRLDQVCPAIVDKRFNSISFRLVKVKIIRNMATGDNEGMPFGHRKAVTDRKGQFALGNNPS